MSSSLSQPPCCKTYAPPVPEPCAKQACHWMSCHTYASFKLISARAVYGLHAFL